MPGAFSIAGHFCSFVGEEGGQRWPMASLFQIYEGSGEGVRPVTDYSASQMIEARRVP